MGKVWLTWNSDLRFSSNCWWFCKREKGKGCGWHRLDQICIQIRYQPWWQRPMSVAMALHRVWGRHAHWFCVVQADWTCARNSRAWISWGQTAAFSSCALEQLTWSPWRPCSGASVTEVTWASPKPASTALTTHNFSEKFDLANLRLLPSDTS